MIVDPGVRLAYDAYAAQNLYTGLNAANVSFLKVGWRQKLPDPYQDTDDVTNPKLNPKSYKYAVEKPLRIVACLKVPVTKWREIEANPIEESMAAVRPLYR